MSFYEKVLKFDVPLQDISHLCYPTTEVVFSSRKTDQPVAAIALWVFIPLKLQKFVLLNYATITYVRDVNVETTIETFARANDEIINAELIAVFRSANGVNLVT